MLNRVTVIGRVWDEPELRYTPINKIATAKFSIVVDFPDRRGDMISTIEVIVHQEKAQTCKKRLKKGHLVALDGYLKVHTFETAGGIRNKTVQVVAEEVQFLSN